MSYTAEGYKDNLTTEEKIKAIDILKTTLGTMVIFPVEKSDPTIIGEKIIAGSVQRPILEGDIRTRALNKLDLLINNL